MVVLRSEDRRASGHHLLCFEEEKPADLFPSPVPSFHDAHLRLDWSQVLTWYVYPYIPHFRYLP